MAELPSLLERPDYGHEGDQLWACANCGRERPSFEAMLVGGLIVCRDNEQCAVVALRLTRAARPAAAPPPRVILGRSRRVAPSRAPAAPTAHNARAMAPRLPYNVRAPAPPPAAAIDVIVRMRQRAREGGRGG